MNEEKKKKLVKGRKKYMKEHYGLVAKIGDDIEIHVDPYRFILLEKGSKNLSYFPCMCCLIEELRDIKAKKLMLQKEEKTLESVRESIIEADLWIEEIIEPLLSVKSKRKSQR